MTTPRKNINYTEEMVSKLHAMYAELGNEGLEEIAEALGKTIKSVRSKLVKDGKYIVQERGTISKESPSKKVILRELEQKGFNTEGFEGATKVALSRLLAILAV